MNDPHVVALNYRIEHCSSVDYGAASPLDYSEDAFEIQGLVILLYKVGESSRSWRGG